MAGATNLNRRKSISKFLPPWAEGNQQAYLDLDSAGINVVTETVVQNTAGLTVIEHSLGVTPAAWHATPVAGPAGPILSAVAFVERSSANNSVIAVAAYTHSATNVGNVIGRFIFFPPAT